MEINRICSIAVLLFLQAQFGQSADYSPAQQAEQEYDLISLIKGSQNRAIPAYNDYNAIPSANKDASSDDGDIHSKSK